MKINIDDYNIDYIDENKNNSEFDILLIHGWGSNKECFFNTINLLKQKYRVVALDLPGFGKSDILKKSFSVDDYVDIVVKFIEKLEIKKVCLIGHSYGGRIIIKINNLNNINFEIVKNVFIDSAGIKNKSLKNIIKIKTFKLLKRAVSFLPIKNDKKNELESIIKNKFGSSDYNNAKKEMRETLIKSVNEDLSNLIKNINKETLIIWGENDTATPIKQAKFFEKNIKNSGLVIIKNTGHFSFIEDQNTYLAVMKSYFNI